MAQNNKRSKSSKGSASRTGNTSNSPAAHWFLTIPMKSIKGEDQIQKCSKLEEIFKKICKKYTFQGERGSETGYDHFQCSIHLKSKMRFEGIKKLFPDAHIEKTCNVEKADLYCMKSDTRLTPVFTYEPGDDKYSGVYDGVPKYDELKPWQKEIVELVKQYPDGRTIYWYYDKKGGVGKTTMARYLMKHHKAAYIQGAKKDVLYAAAQTETRLYVFGFARTVENYVSYESLECIKDALYFAAKYESATVFRNWSHVLVFANFEPDYSKLSSDRWKVTCLDD